MSAKILLRGEGSERLADRRRRHRRRASIALAVVALLLAGAALYGLWQPGVRISRIEISGADSLIVAQAREALQGSYYGLVPHDSILFFPERNIRARILDKHPSIVAVSMTRKGLSGLAIAVSERTPVARWCGLGPTAGVEPYCYVFDPGGFVFAAAASTTKTLNPFTVYAPLQGDTLEPLRARVAHADDLPTAFDFARQLGALGAPVTAVVFRGDEVDDLLSTGARVTYLLGDEQNAYTALVSVRANVNPVDPALEYVDLRFPGKVYVKRINTALPVAP